MPETRIVRVLLLQFTVISPNRKETFYNMFLDYPHNLTPEQKEVLDKEANPCKDAGFQWKFFNLISFIYSAGRIQGIREERAKKNA